jgi:hypothetical protein
MGKCSFVEYGTECTRVRRKQSLIVLLQLGTN